MEFRELSIADCELVRQWRNQNLEALRTPYALTKEMQEQFYKDVICNRNARARYWGIWIEDKVSSTFVGMCGLENIEWENSLAEISIIMRPDMRGRGFGEKAVNELLMKGFYVLGLKTIWGECYHCNEAISFWEKIASRYKATIQTLPNRKFYNGLYSNSMYFSFDKEDFTYGSNNTRLEC